MQEIFRKLNPQNQTDKTEIEFEVNSQNIIGGSMIKEHRLVYFEAKQSEPFYIDFVPYHGITNTIYLIPSGHLLYLPISTTNFHCINVPHSCLNDFEKCCIYSLKYKNEKSMHSTHLNTQQLANLQGKNIIQNILYNPIAPNTSTFQYLQHAEDVMVCLSRLTCCHQLSVNDLLNELSISEKTLQRVCNAIFEFQPTQILRYHLTLKIVFHIINDKQKSFTEIVNELNFRDVSTFGRYVKTLTKFTPKEIRTTYSHIVL